jgi:hypothetical protein
MSSRWAVLERAEAPDVDNPTEDYMVRWRLVQTPWFGVYVHRINTADTARPLPHTHPWWFVSLIVAGGYSEVYERRDRTGRLRRRWPHRRRRLGAIHLVRSTDAHTITQLHRSPSYTIAVAGRRRAEPSWGYWDGDHFIAWDQHPYANAFAAALASRRASPQPPTDSDTAGPND